MKANLRFLFMVVLIFCLSALSVTTIVDVKKAGYEGGGYYYISNNPRGVQQRAGLLLNALDSKKDRVSGTDDSGKHYWSEFSQVTLSQGRYPQSRGEYIAVEGSASEPSGNERKVGEYKETFTLNGIGRIFKLLPEDSIHITEIFIADKPDQKQEELLKNEGFVAINAQNIDRKINSELYNTIGMILRLFSIVLLCMALVSWISFLVKKVNDSGKEFQVFAFFGADRLETLLAYLYLQRRFLLRVFIEAFILYNLIGAAAAFVIDVNWFLPLDVVWLLCSFFVILSLGVAVQIKISALRWSGHNLSHKTVFCLLFLLLIIGTLIGIWLSKPVFVFTALLMFVIVLLVRRQSVLTKALFSRMGTISVSLFLVLCILTMINAVILSIWRDTNNREEETVQTTMPYNALIQTDSLPSTISDQSAYHRHSYINPVNGASVNGEQTHPLFYSTDLNRYKQYCNPNDAIGRDSVLIGRTLAQKSHSRIGSVLEVNGVKLTVTHIVDTNQYAGMMVYLSDQTFSKVFGDTGTIYYGTDLNNNEVKKHFKTEQIQTKAEYRRYYENSMSQVLLILYALNTIILIIGIFIAYRIFAIFIDFIRWKLNLMRGFGISFTEYAGTVYLQCMCIITATFFAVFIFFQPIGNYLTDRILEVTDSYFPIVYEPLFFIVTLAEFLLLVGAVSVISYRIINKSSIYRQYLQTTAEG